MKNLQPNSLPAAQRQVSHSNNNSQNKKPRMERQWPEEQKMAGVVYSVNQPKMLNWFHKQLSPADDFTVVSREHEGEDAEAVFTRRQQECLVDIMFSVYVAHVNWKVVRLHMWTESVAHYANWKIRSCCTYVAWKRQSCCTYVNWNIVMLHICELKYTVMLHMWTERYGHVVHMWTERYSQVAHICELKDMVMLHICELKDTVMLHMWTKVSVMVHTWIERCSSCTCGLKDTVMLHT